MKDTYWGYWLIVLGIFIVVVMMIVNNITTTKSQDYYLVKEIAQASMIDAVDYGYYRNSGGIIRVDREKFLESFIRRFADAVDTSKTYNIKVIDFNETPPKVSIRVGTQTVAAVAGENFDIVNQIDAILETKYEEKRTLDEAYTD